MDANPKPMAPILAELGPLRALAGIWEGDKGDDVAPSDDRGVENNKFRERMVLEPFGPVNNHEQVLWGLKYSTIAWRLAEADSFHEETGYWLWDPQTQEVMRCFLVPRGISVLAGGKVAVDAKKFALAATLGAATYGICSNPFLDREFQTVRYELEVEVIEPGYIRYKEDTQMKMKGRAELFHHTDENWLRRVKEF